MTFRFGTKAKIEIVYPAVGVRPQAAFRGGVGGYSGGGADYIRFRNGNTTYIVRRGGRRPNLQTMARHRWATLTASDAKGTTGRGQRNLRREVGGQLNPTWCEWFMGFPDGWTELGHLEMRRFHAWLMKHGRV